LGGGKKTNRKKRLMTVLTLPTSKNQVEGRKFQEGGGTENTRKVKKYLRKNGGRGS